MVINWNWKTALLCAVFRTLLFVAPYFGYHHQTVARTFWPECVYALIVSGFYGALTQSYCRAEPRWLSTALLLTATPATNQVLDFAMHRMLDAPTGPISMSLSFAVTFFSTLFSIHAVRRGYLTTNGGIASPHM